MSTTLDHELRDALRREVSRATLERIAELPDPDSPYEREMLDTLEAEAMRRRNLSRTVTRPATAPVAVKPPPKRPRPAAGSPLSVRKLEIVARIAAGDNNREIARELWVTEETIKSHIKQALKLTGCRTRAHLAAHCVARGLVELARREGHEV